MRIVTIVGARPQFIKAAMVSRELRRRRDAGAGAIEELLVHTGQHFDANMSSVFFDQMDIPAPHANLGVAGGTHGEMTGRMLERVEPVLRDAAPDWVLVYGDTNSTLAGALAAAKLGLPVAHVEAGLRSFDAAMPEEINRVVADRLASLLLAPTARACENLRREGVDPSAIVRTGDVMYDAMLHHLPDAPARARARKRLGIGERAYVLATVHRAANTDEPARLRGVIEGLMRIAASIDVVMPLHPRTRKALDRAGLLDRAATRLGLIDPIGYLDMIALERDAALIATDSGGVQKEAYLSGVPCITLRDETEWVETVEIGANTLVGADPERIEDAARAAMGGTVAGDALYGTGRAAKEIVDALLAGPPVKVAPTAPVIEPAARRSPPRTESPGLGRSPASAARS